MMRMRKIGIVLILGGLLVWGVIGAAVALDIARPSLSTPTALTLPPTRAAIRASTVPSETPTAKPTAIPSTVTPTLPPDTPVIPIPTLPPSTNPPTDSPLPITSPAPSLAAVESPSASAGTPNGCPLPAGWVVYSVTNGDTLFGFQLGSKNTVSVDQIMAANCLKSKFLAIGQVIYLPPGVAANAPKVDDSPAEGASLPAGLNRTPKCPCTLSIRSGWRREQIAAALDAIPVGFTGRDFLAVTNGGVTVSGFGALSSKPAAASLEGFLYPGTYTIQNDTTAQGLRDTLLRAFEAAIPEGLRNDAAGRGLSFYEALILASVVQRESYSPIEQVKVASVMYNRMAAGKALSSTVTVQYAIGRSGAWWPGVTGTDLKNRSKYNTYIWLGLPPTPISNPDFNAINSTIHPAQTDFQYFNSSCEGPGNFYTVTYEEFEAMLKKCGVLK